MKGNGTPPVDFTEINNKISQTNTDISQINTTISNYWNKIYPVNSIYMSVNSTSPATLFGGTWVQLKDRFLLGAGSSYSNGATGGTNSHTHDLSNGYGKMSSSGNYLHWNYKYVDTYNTNWTLG